MKNYRTPRTLAECEFTVGYSERTRRAIDNPWMFAAVVIALGVIGLAVSA